MISLVHPPLIGDYNPIHTGGDQGIVHGTYLLGLVSALVGKLCLKHKNFKYLSLLGTQLR